ncbi:MAG: Fic family protein [Pseudomonadota bacterium]
MRETGVYQVLGDLQYFVPHPLPPSNPPLTLTPDLMQKYGEASFALGQLNGLSVPNVQRFIKAYVVKEALLSSEIEGIHTTLIEVFTQPLGQAVISKDTQLVLNYSKALEAALQLMQCDGLPLVSRVLLRAHEVLMSAGESEKSSPGQLRRQSVRVGAHVPPPAPELARLMSDLERYMNEPSDMSPLIRAGLAHVQFEIIHPFLDGNGRIGRLLIVLMLMDGGLLTTPILYPSYYFKKYQMDYYRSLDRVRTHGDFEGWLAYYLCAIRDSAQDAYRRAIAIEILERDLKTKISAMPDFQGIQQTALGVLDALFAQPITTVSMMSHALGKSYNTVHRVLVQFVALGIVLETPVKRNKRYHFTAYLDLLEKEFHEIK